MDRRMPVGLANLTLEHYLGTHNRWHFQTAVHPSIAVSEIEKIEGTIPDPKNLRHAAAVGHHMRAVPNHDNVS